MKGGGGEMEKNKRFVDAFVHQHFVPIMTSASDLIVFRTAGDGRCERQVLPLLCFI